MEFAPFGQIFITACGGRVKAPPEAAKQLS
jgi:hypothetical protein